MSIHARARRSPHSSRLQIAAALGAASLLGSAGAAHSRDEAHAFLKSAFGITDKEISRVDNGQVVARTLQADDSREVATMGIVRMPIAPDVYVAGFDDIAEFKKDDAVLEVGAFGDPPALDDVGELTLDESDIKSLRDCRVGSCGLQLSAEAIERFAREIDWRRPDAGQQAQALMRRILVEHANAYWRSGGAGAGLTYADREKPLSLADEFKRLAASDLGGWQYFSPLRRHIVEYPTGTPGVRDLLYWSREQVGRRTVASVTHLSIHRCASGLPAEYAVASKQIYGSHYFDASLGLTALVPNRSSPTPVTYVVYVNRSRVDVFRGVFGGFARRVVTSKARSTVEGQLARLRTRLGARP